MSYSSRRFRRRLLPVGWVALGLLLPLSCWLLSQHPKRWRRTNVMQLTMPPLRPDTSGWGALLPRLDSADYSPMIEADGPRVPGKLARMRPWRNFALLGEAGLDSVSLSGVEAAVKAIQADTEHAGGVRVRLGQQVAYRELVKLLDIMSRLDQKKYWLDIVHRPTTFYIITPRPLTLAERQQVLPAFSFCGTSSDVYLPVVARTKLENLRLPERHPQVLLTLAVTTLLLAALAGTLVLALGTRR